MTVVLDTRGYRVRNGLLIYPDLCLVLHTLLDAGKGANAFGRRACREFGEVPILAAVLGKSNMAKPGYPATRTLYAPDMGEILEAIRIIARRKRGPKKKEVIAC